MQEIHCEAKVNNNKHKTRSISQTLLVNDLHNSYRLNLCNFTVPPFKLYVINLLNKKEIREAVECYLAKV
jgi:hypothetical protein